MTKEKWKFHLALLSIVTLVPLETLAQLEEVIVVAQKREENVQTVPIAVSTFSEETIRNATMLTMDDYSRHTPGFTVTNFNPVTPQPFIRGIGSSPSDAGSDASVGVFIDGVYAGRAGGYRADMFDIQRVEVLRGPQGTLFGRNVAGGALNVLSNLPEEELAGELELTAGNYDLWSARGMVTGPLTDQLWGRFAFATRQRDGHTDNSITGSELRDEDNTSARGRLLWNGDSVSIVATAEYSEDDLDGPAARNYEGIDPFYILDDLGFGFLDSFLAETTSDPYTIEAGEDGHAEREMYAGSVQVDWDVTLGTVTSITAYRKNDYSFFDDLLGLGFVAGTPFDPLLTNYAQEESDQFTQELRLTSADQDMRWTVGLYYLEEDVDRLEAFAPIGIPVSYDQQVSTTSYALFGQVTYPLTDKLDITLGGRYSYDKKDFELVTEGLEIGLGLLTPDPENPDAGAVPFSSSADEDWSNFSPKLSLDYAAGDHTFLYFTVSDGYKSGGYNGQSTNQFVAKLPFDEENVRNYEFGIKTDFLDRQARLNLAIFYMDYDDLQVFVVSAETKAGVFVDNAAEAEITGLEAEFYYAPTNELDVTLTYAWLDAEIGDNEIPEVDKGNRLTRSPEHAFSASVQYHWPINGFGELLTRADYSWQDDFYFILNNPEMSRQDAYGLLNLRVALQSNEGWEIALWGKNVLEEEYWVHAIDPSYGSDLGASGIQGDPRTYGITGRYRW